MRLGGVARAVGKLEAKEAIGLTGMLLKFADESISRHFCLVSVCTSPEANTDGRSEPTVPCRARQRACPALRHVENASAGVAQWGPPQTPLHRRCLA